MGGDCEKSRETKYLCEKLERKIKIKQNKIRNRSIYKSKDTHENVVPERNVI